MTASLHNNERTLLPGPLACWPCQLKAKVVNGASHLANLGCMLAEFGLTLASSELNKWDEVPCSRPDRYAMQPAHLSVAICSFYLKKKQTWFSGHRPYPNSVQSQI